MALEKHVWEVMESSFPVIQPDASVEEAIGMLSKEMDKKRYAQGIVVIDSAKRFKGIVTIKDILAHMKGLFDATCQTEEGPTILDKFTDKCRMDAAKKVSEIMKRESVSVAPSERLVDALRKAMSDQVRILPVVEGNRAVGVLYLHDIFSVMKELMRV